MTKTEFIDWLDSFLNFEKFPQKNIFWLDTMLFLAQKLGNPEKAVPCFHVAGSKGKGSVSRMISSILTEHGLKTGLYTSPHISDFFERLTQNGALFKNEIYLDAAKALHDTVESIPLNEFPAGRPVTWFELVTLFAFLTFRRAETDVNVFEVGLGGRLDATNIIQPKISVINTIELEHTEYLGDTLEKIAGEKAGIIKEKTPVLCAAAIPGVRKIFEKKAAALNSPVYFADDLCKKLDFAYEKEGASHFMRVEFSSPIFTRPLCARMRLLGQVQAQNAFLAAAAVRLAMPRIPEETIERGLEKAFLRARFEVVDEHFILDGAHTVNSIRGTIETFDAIFGNKNSSEYRTAHLLFACAADKDVEHIAPLFKRQDGSPRFAHITLTKLTGAKQSNPRKTAEAFRKNSLVFTLQENYEKAVLEAFDLAKKENAVLLCTGSFYLAAEILSTLQK